MIWLPSIRINEAEGAAKEIIDGIRSSKKPVPKLFLTLALRPPVLAGREAARKSVHGGASTLGRRREELLSFYVATLGSCYG